MSTFTWRGNDNRWSYAGNWIENQVPPDGSDVVIDAGNVIVTWPALAPTAPVTLKSLTINLSDRAGAAQLMNNGFPNGAISVAESFTLTNAVGARQDITLGTYDGAKIQLLDGCVASVVLDCSLNTAALFMNVNSGAFLEMTEQVPGVVGVGGLYLADEVAHQGTITCHSLGNISFPQVLGEGCILNMHGPAAIWAGFQVDGQATVNLFDESTILGMSVNSHFTINARQGVSLTYCAVNEDFIINAEGPVLIAGATGAAGKAIGVNILSPQAECLQMEIADVAVNVLGRYARGMSGTMARC
ncbi:MAG: hypothetical protein ABFD92_07840 [Planctomycetaceae bacterium]|nr:hypothetical protein [Planctomycetaceae bacterium]